MRGILLAITLPLAPLSTVPPADNLARFSWDAVADASVTGYKVHWGTSPGTYTNVADVGNVTEVILAGFVEGTRYYAAGTAYSATEESDYSPEITFVYELEYVTITTQRSTDLQNWTDLMTIKVLKKAAEFFRTKIETPTPITPQ